MKKNVIVTGSDKKYYPFLKNLVNSLINSNSLDICDLCILDVEDNSQYLEELDSKITKKTFYNFRRHSSDEKEFVRKNRWV